GRIISIGGDSAGVGQQRPGVSAGARGAVLSLTRTLAKELGRQNITVNSLALGWIETSHSDKEFIAKNRERILAFYPIRRLGKPEDVAPLVAFLASDLAGWVTGQTISVSGGECAGLRALAPRAFAGHGISFPVGGLRGSLNGCPASIPAPPPPS